MTPNETCPHCGAEMAYDDPHYTRFKCGAVVWRDGTTGRRDYACYITELEKKDAEIEHLKADVQSILGTVQAAVQMEREACAAECRNWWKAEDCEKAIMARGEVK